MTTSTVDVFERDKYQMTDVEQPRKVQFRLVQVSNAPGSFSEKYQATVRHRVFLPPRLEVLNIPFLVRRDESGFVHLESDQWPSLSAFGEDVGEAVSNLVSLLKDAINEFVFVREEDLAEDAIEFRNFLISKLF